jgi:hypothetical protein
VKKAFRNTDQAVVVVAVRRDEDDAELLTDASPIQLELLLGVPESGRFNYRASSSMSHTSTTCRGECTTSTESGSMTVGSSENST